MNVINEIAIAATAPPPPKVDSQKNNDGDHSFQGELDVKLKATQETQKQTEEQEKGTGVLAGAGAVSAQASQAVLMQEVVNLVEQGSVSGQQTAEVPLPTNQAAETTGLQLTQVTTAPRELFSEVLSTQQVDPQEELASQIAELKPVVSINQSAASSASGVDPSASVTAAPETAPAVLESSKAVIAMGIDKPEIPAETLASSENKVQMQGLSTAVETVNDISDTQDVPVMQQVIDGIKKMSNEGQTTLRLQLHPENMGKIDVRLVSKPDGMQVFITTDKSSTNQLLESNLAQLRESLQNAGIKIGGMNVGQQQNQGNFQSWQSQQTFRYAYSPSAGFEPRSDLLIQGSVGALSALDARV